MEPIVDFKILPERLRQAAQVVTVAVASPADSHTEEVIERSIAEQFARFILVANAAKADIARRLAADYPDKVTLIVAEDDDDAARHAVKEVREGRADVLMKGSLNTDNLLRAVLNKEEGILIKGSVLTHIAVADVPSLNHLLFFTDAAVIPYPTTEQFDALARYHNRVGHVSRTVAHLRYIVGDERTEIAHVLVLGVDEVLLHLLVDGVDTTVQRLQQTAATYHGIELQRYSSLLEQLQHEILAILILLVNGSELVLLLLRVQSVRCPYSTFVFIHSHLR
jgi:hypothetical protein